MALMSLDDAMFLLGEAPGRPNHVIALQLFKPPAEGIDVAEVYSHLLDLPVKTAFRRRAARRVLSPSGFEWRDDGMDVDYHVRHLGLPPPGRVRELLEIVSLQHGVTLDRNRPLWEYYLVSGLEDGRFAAAFKTHHALADGITLARHTLGGMSPDPKSRDCLPPWAGDDLPRSASSGLSAGQLPRFALASLRSTVAATLALQKLASDVDTHVPFEAPHSVLNGGITGARRFAGDKWPHARLKGVATSASCSVNDVVLAMCGAALRSYLLELDALPDRSLISMVPVSLRRDGDGMDANAGNAFGSILCDLHTSSDDAIARLEGIARTMTAAKQRMRSLSRGEALALSRMIMGGAAISALTGITNLPRQPFNLIVSNVPATPFPLYFNGAEMTDIYPISMISEGQRLNITVTRYAENLTFGIVGDRKSLPHLQRMLIHLEDALTELEKNLT